MNPICFFIACDFFTRFVRDDQNSVGKNMEFAHKMEKVLFLQPHQKKSAFGYRPSYYSGENYRGYDFDKNYDYSKHPEINTNYYRPYEEESVNNLAVENFDNLQKYDAYDQALNYLPKQMEENSHLTEPKTKNMENQNAELSREILKTNPPRNSEYSEEALGERLYNSRNFSEQHPSFSEEIGTDFVAKKTDNSYHIPLDNNGTAVLRWNVNYDERYCNFEVQVEKLNHDWYALGFAENYNNFPADYCFIWRDQIGDMKIADVWLNENGTLSVDKQQDCLHLRSRFSKKNRVKSFTFDRKFDTCDDLGDNRIQEGTMNIAWMSGRGRFVDIRSFNKNESEPTLTLQRTQLLKMPNPRSESLRYTRVFQVTARDVKVPGADTTYWCRVVKLPDYIRLNAHHVVKFESAIQLGNEGLVHHMEVFHCATSSPNDTITPYEGSCFDQNRPQSTQVCKKVIAAWAMGAPPFSYPKETGVVIGGKDFNPYVMLEIHYNNPGLRKDWIDSSGMKLTVTSKLRKYNAGIMELGLEYTDKMAIPPNLKAFELSGYCTSECTSAGIPWNGITIFGSQLHTHLTGVKVLTRHIRDGRELEELNRDNHYSTHFQEIRLLKRPKVVLPGDALITSCTYETTDRKNVTLGGFGIRDEMCVNYVHYYPKVDLEVCKSSISDQALSTYFRYMKEWQNQNISVKNGISQNYQLIAWNSEFSSHLESYYKKSSLSMQCNQSSGVRFPGEWENVPQPSVQFALLPPPRICKREDYFKN